MTAKRNFLHPGSIAIVGASRDPSKIGSVVLDNIIKSGYKGHLYPVNPNARVIRKLKVHKSVLDIPGKVDMAIVIIPAKYVAEVVADCGVKGIKDVVIISAGFGETGEKGYGREVELIELAQKYSLNILGPNCLGFMNKGADLNATFAYAFSHEGSLAFASQSGAMGTSFLDWASKNNIGLKYFASIGNKAVLNENHFLKEFGKDKDVSTILFYLEDFANGREFYELAKKISLRKPIIVLKPGASEEAQQAMASHTGSIAQDDKIIDAALAESGCIRVGTIEELFQITKLVAWQPLPKGNRVAVITNAGGVGIQSVDDLENNGLHVIPFSKSLQKKLKKQLPGESSVQNPVDLLGDALAERYKEALELVIKDRSIDSVLVVLTPQMVTQSLETAKFVNTIADKNKKTVMASFVGGESISEAGDLLAKEQIPQYHFPNDAARALGLLHRWRTEIKRIKTDKAKIYNPTLVNNDLAWGSDKGVVYLMRAQELIRKYKIPLLESAIREKRQDVIKAAKRVKYPLVLKLVHPKLIHKTEFKAVRLGIDNEFQLQSELRELDKLAHQNKLKGYSFELQPYIEDKIEVIIGIKKDTDTYRKYKDKDYLKTKGFGHILLFGSGGIYTEVYKDVSLRLLPISKLDAEEMILETKVGKIVQGIRGKSYNFSGIISVLENLSKLVSENTNISAIDINPLFVTKHDVYVADLKMFVG